MTEQPDLSTLPQRMRYAADVLCEADERYGSKYSWSPDGLKIYAAKYEDQDHIADLALSMFELLAGVPYDAIMFAARGLIRAGWRKGDPA